MRELFIQINKGSRQALSRPVGYIIRENGCWEWQGGRDGKGYGRWRGFGAHRWMYERAKGAIPKGLQIDHLCRNTRCVNPDHLEAVTARENVLRGDSPRLSRERLTRFSPTAKASAVSRVVNGESMGEVARDIGTVTAAVSRWVNAAGVVFTRRKSRYS